MIRIVTPLSISVLTALALSVGVVPAVAQETVDPIDAPAEIEEPAEPAAAVPAPVDTEPREVDWSEAELTVHVVVDKRRIPGSEPEQSVRDRFYPRELRILDKPFWTGAVHAITANADEIEIRGAGVSGTIRVPAMNGDAEAVVATLHEILLAPVSEDDVTRIHVDLFPDRAQPGGRVFTSAYVVWRRGDWGRRYLGRGEARIPAGLKDPANRQWRKFKSERADFVEAERERIELRARLGKKASLAGAVDLVAPEDEVLGTTDRGPCGRAKTALLNAVEAYCSRTEPLGPLLTEFEYWKSQCGSKTFHFPELPDKWKYHYVEDPYTEGFPGVPATTQAVSRLLGIAAQRELIPAAGALPEKEGEGFILAFRQHRAQFGLEWEPLFRGWYGLEADFSGSPFGEDDIWEGTFTIGGHPVTYELVQELLEELEFRRRDPIYDEGKLFGFLRGSAPPASEQASL